MWGTNKFKNFWNSDDFFQRKSLSRRQIYLIDYLPSFQYCWVSYVAYRWGEENWIQLLMSLVIVFLTWTP